MRKFAMPFLLISFLALAGCQKEPPFDPAAFMPSDAEVVIVKNVNFDGDKLGEKALYYKSGDTQYLAIFQVQDNAWQKVKEDTFVNKGVVVPRFLRDFYAFNFGNDAREELFVQWSGERSTPGIGSYYILTKTDGAYQSIEAPSLDAHAYLDAKKGETEMYPVAFNMELNGIKETYEIFCARDMRGKPMSSRYEKSCRRLPLNVVFENGILKREPKL